MAFVICIIRCIKMISETFGWFFLPENVIHRYETNSFSIETRKFPNFYFYGITARPLLILVILGLGKNTGTAPTVFSIIGKHSGFHIKAGSVSGQRLPIPE